MAARTPAARLLSLGQAVALDDALVVQAHQRDDLIRVAVGGDRSRTEARLAREDRVVVDPARVEELLPDVFREAEVRDARAVQVADLARADLEGVFAAPARPGGHAG